MSIKSAFSEQAPTLDQYDKVLAIFESPSIYVYARGYLDAVEKLIGGLTSFSASDDPLIYPCLFLIRHCFELLLKNYLRSLIDHYKRCRIVKSAVHNTNYVSLDQHMLIPIYEDIYKLRSIASHHHNVTIADLRDDLEFLDSIDPEATAFRYEKTKADTDQIIHRKQQWVDIRQILETARSIYYYLKEQAESVDLRWCATGFFSQSSIQTLRWYSSSLTEFIEWIVAKNAELDRVEHHTDGSLLWDASRLIEYREKTDRLYSSVEEHFSLSRLKNVIVGYYIGREEEGQKGDFQFVNGYEKAIGILRTKSTEALISQLARLNGLIAELEEMNRKIPFPK